VTAPQVDPGFQRGQINSHAAELPQGGPAAWRAGACQLRPESFALAATRVQTGVRLEKRLVEVLKALTELQDLALGDLIEHLVRQAFAGKPPLNEPVLEQVYELMRIYGLDPCASRRSAAKGRVVMGLFDTVTVDVLSAGVQTKQLGEGMLIVWRNCLGSRSRVCPTSRPTGRSRRRTCPGSAAPDGGRHSGRSSAARSSCRSRSR
jgi:hypothetical protein